MDHNFIHRTGTLMRHHSSTQGAVLMDIEGLHDQIVRGTYKVLIEEIRDLDRKQQDSSARKSLLPLFVCQGDCRERRMLSKLKSPTGYAPFDIDHIPFAKSRAIISQAATIPWIKEAHLSCRYGVHLFCLMGVIEASSEQEYALEYRRRYVIMAESISRIFNAECDKQCKDVLRGIYPSYDPNAIIRPDSEMQAFDFTTEAKPASELTLSSPCQHTTSDETDVPNIIHTLVESFLTFNQYKRSMRHGFWVKYALYLKNKGIGSDNLMAYKDAMVELLRSHNLIEPDDPNNRLPNEVKDAMLWGWEHQSEKTHSAISSNTDQDLALCEEEVIASYCPLLPDDVYEHLPQCISLALAPITESPIMLPPRRKDALLLALLTNYSALLPEVHVSYGSNDHAPSLGFICISNAGNGKSIISNAFKIGEPTDDYLHHLTDEAIEVYKAQLETWQDERSQALKHNRKPDDTKRPPSQPPKEMLLIMPSITSKSVLTRCLNAMDGFGMIINSSEIRSLTSSLKQEVGNYSDLLCKAMSNEPIDQFFKVDGRPIKIRHPKLSICLSGTFDQFHEFIPSLEDGLFSRFLYYMMEPFEQWISQRPNNQKGNYKDDYKMLGEDALLMFQFLKENPTDVIFSQEQWDRHDMQWRSRLNNTVDEGINDRLSIVTRHGEFQMRIAAILTALRRWENHDSRTPTTATCVCSDQDFDTSAKIIATCLQHALILSTTMANNTKQNVLPMSKWEWKDEALESLPNEFSSRDFIDMARRLNRSPSQAYRALIRLRKNGKIQQSRKGSKKWKKTS